MVRWIDCFVGSVFVFFKVFFISGFLFLCFGIDDDDDDYKDVYVYDVDKGFFYWIE